MRFYKKNNVLEEARERIAFLFDEFEEIIVSFSGGKDSSVVFHLAMEEAKKRNRLPLNVLFIDQEAEWTYTIDIVKNIMYDKNVRPYWFQMPIKLSNATTYNEDYWLYCWNEGSEWIRQKDEISIKENNHLIVSHNKPYLPGSASFYEGNEAFFRKMHPEHNEYVKKLQPTSKLLGEEYYFITQNKQV